MTVVFRELSADRTEVRITQTNAPPSMRSPEAQAGFLTSLDKFADYVRRRR